MKVWHRGVLALVLGATGIAAAQQDRVPPLRPMVQAEQSTSVVAVLGYGAIGKEGGLSVQEFSQQMRYLQSAGCHPVSTDAFLSWRAGLAELPENAVLLTFEQVDAAFVQNVFPILRACSFPFLLFVDARKLGTTADSLSVRDLQMMVRMGASVGCESGGPESEKLWQAAELQGRAATQTLAETELGAPARRLRSLCGSCDVFSYGTQKADVSLLRQLVRLGFAIAFSRTEGKSLVDSPGFMLPRYVVDSHLAFARAVNFGPKGQELGIAAAMEDARPAGAVPNAAMAVDFEDDMVAEEVEDDAEPVEPPAPLPAKPAATEQVATEPAATEQVVAPQPETAASPPPEPAPGDVFCGNLYRPADGGDWRTARFESPLVPREQTRVAVLGYHNFSNTKPVSEMRMRTSEFCQQMQYIKDAGLSVITMQDFIDWRFGSRCLPERCILITIDDGWKSVYTDAYPVLKAYGYPFTMFLYTRYINVQGDSMTVAQIQEMLQNGATVGSHSANHLYPKSWKRYNQDSPEYAQQVQKEILDSATTLKGKFGSCSTYCYPGGYHTQPMIDGLAQSSYRCAFTVIESKVDCTEDPWQVHRYMVFGVNPGIFRRAVNFDGEEGIVPTRMGIAASMRKAQEFFPKAFEGCSPADWDSNSVSGHIAKRVGKARKSAKSKAKKTPAAPVEPAAPTTPPAAP